MSKKKNLIMESIPESGPLFVPMTNDYLFRAILQRNKKILKGLTCALLGLQDDEVTSVAVINPIELGKAIDEKSFILDILVELNNKNLINLEMQVINEHNWVERSLAYLCRTFNSLKEGDPYSKLRPVHQIGILNFTLFDDAPEFYANYELLNVKSLRRYSDKIKLSVLDLTRIDLATDEDKRKELDYWAELFKSRTWEEICMLAEKEPIFKEVAAEVNKLSSEEQIRQQCLAREDYYRTQLDFKLYYENKLNEKDDAIKEKDEIIKENAETIEEQRKLIAELQARLADK